MADFTLLNTDGRARRTSLKTVHGVIETPVFMNVGTAAAIRGGVGPEDLPGLGCTVELSNTYHLHLRPGDELIKKLGGIRKFMNWSGPVLTDSGGFQVFSLAHRRRITEKGVSFDSYIDGRRVFIGPEESIAIQSNLGSTIAMAFDECVENPSPKDYVARSIDRTTRWLERSREELIKRNAREDAVNPEQLLFGINQGGVYPDLRVQHMRQIRDIPCDGYAIGGLSVGESAETMYEIIDAVEPEMPKDRPRYLMGVGTPLNILEAVNLGVDFFDCVLPLRNAQHGNVFTWNGRLRLLAEKHRLDERPIDEGCGCPACRNHSRAYIRHLLKADERLGMRLCILHNLYFYNDLTAKMRAAIEDGTFEAFYNKYRRVLGEFAEE